VDGDTNTVTLSVQQARSISAAVSRAFEYSDKLDSCRVAMALQDSLLSKVERGYEDVVQEQQKQIEQMRVDAERGDRKLRRWKTVSAALTGAVLVMLGLVI